MWKWKLSMRNDDINFDIYCIVATVWVGGKENQNIIPQNSFQHDKKTLNETK